MTLLPNSKLHKQETLIRFWREDFFFARLRLLESLEWMIEQIFYPINRAEHFISLFERLQARTRKALKNYSKSQLYYTKYKGELLC